MKCQPNQCVIMASTTTTTSNSNVSYTTPILSYNTTGWSTFKADFVNTILFSHGILIAALQEHFQLKDNLYKLDCFNNFEVFSIPAFKNNNFVHAGRPSGGISFIYSNSLCQYATRLVCPGSYRVQGLKINYPDAAFLYINVYFPTDTNNHNFDDHELLTTLQDIKYLLDRYSDGCVVVLMGDLNTDLSRNTHFVQIVKNFLYENNLITSWSKFDCDFTYYHERNVRGRTITSKSIIDHFCVNTETLDFCVDASPLHMAANLSNHSPIFLKIDWKGVPIKPVNSDSNNQQAHGPRPQWHKASTSQIGNYQKDLRLLVDNIDIDNDALCCRDAHCTSADHIGKLENMCNDLLQTISTAVDSNIPTNSSGSAGSNIIPGWSDYIKPYKEASIFWDAVWVSAGRPLDTELHKLMKHTRNQFHYAIRRVKRQEQELRKSKFLSACLDGKVSDILHDIKSARNKNSKPSTVIDGHSESADIAENFKDIYCKIYNTHNDKDDLKQFIDENNAKISDVDIQLVDSITPEMVKKFIRKFNNNKNDSTFNWKSDALKAGVDILADPLCDLLTSLILHGYIPKVFLVCSLVPIVKDNKESKLSSSNYRLIAITSLLLKLFDHILLEFSNTGLKPSHLQFGFQKGLSTSLCTWSLTETVNHFRNRGSPIFMCLMDLTKAFDLVKLSILFRKLSDKVSPIFIRFLICSYLNQECQVSWSGVKSSSFNISNGVRQGAVASPVLFNTYINELFEELSSSGFGCQIDHLYFGAFGYADDIGLLAPSREALQQMINICARFFKLHGIKISTNINVNKTKTKVLVFGVQSEPAVLFLGDKPLPYAQEWKHLGHIINADENPVHDLEEKKRGFIGKLHSLRQELGAQDPRVFMKLIKIYLLHLYGCVMWDIFSLDSIQLWTTWHQTIKSLFNLPLATHRNLLNDLVDCDHIKKIIIKRFMKFSGKIAASSNPHIKLLHYYQSRDWRSTYGRNIMNICSEANANSLSDVDLTDITINPIPAGGEWRVGLLHDLLQERVSNAGLLTEQEVQLMMDFVCSK